MRPWLETMIDSNKIPGLRWLDQERTMFSIPWKHAARHGWEMNKDASLFKEWAKHTGKYVEGQVGDAKTWKANFRCAMNSLPDIEEVKDKSVNKGHGAVRVFRMLPVTQKSKERKRLTKRRQNKAKFDDSSDSDSVPSPTQVHLPSPQDYSIDTTVKREPTDTTYINHEVQPWSYLGFDYPRNIQVSPEHTILDDHSIPDDQQFVEMFSEWEEERTLTSSVSNNAFLSNEASCNSPGSMYSEHSSADELDEPQYTSLDNNNLFTPINVNDIEMNLLRYSLNFNQPLL